MNKKILFVSSAPFDGGAEKSLYTYLSGSSAAGHVLIVHTNTRLSPEIQKANRVYRLPFAWLVKTSNPLLLLYFLVNWIYCSLQVYLISRRHGVGLVFANTFKTYLFTLFTKLFIRLRLMVCLRDNLSARWQKKLLIMPDQIITISGHIQDQLEHKAAAKVIHPCVRKRDYSPAFRDPYAKKKPGQITIATIGQLVPWKGQLDFLKIAETFKSHDHVQFLIIGDDHTEANQAYRQEVIERANALKNVEFLGYVEELNPLLSKIDILIHLAEKEPFGRVIVEAMQAKKAVIALRSGGIPEIIEHEKSGILVDQELALFQSRKALLDLLQSPAKRLIMGREANRRASQFTDINHHIEQVNQLLHVTNEG